MASTEEPKGAETHPSESSPENGAKLPSTSEPAEDSYSYIDDGYPTEDHSPQAPTMTVEPPVTAEPPPAALAPSSGGGRTPPQPPPPSDEEDEEDDGMLRMSFLDHLEELRSRLIRMLIGVGVAFVGSLTFSDKLWMFVQEPAHEALLKLKANPTTLIAIDPMDQFNIIWVKLPILAAVFLSCPWILYQIWAFIAPGLYKRERRWAAPFVIGSAGLFIIGGLFGYFVAFRFGLTFLLGLGRANYITPMVSVTEYF